MKNEQSIADRRRQQADIVKLTGIQHVKLNSFHPELQSALDRVVLDLRRTQTKLIRGVRRAVPKYGLFTLLARKTSFFIYDHPVFTKICDTAFTDGRHIYFSAAFTQELLQSEEDNPGCVELLPLVLHELSHILYQHHRRILNGPPDLARAAFSKVRNIAMDKAINARIKATFHDMPLGPLFLELAYGLDDVPKYTQLLEEQIFAEDLQEMRREQANSAQMPPDSSPQSGMAASDADAEGAQPSGEADSQPGSGAQPAPSQDALTQGATGDNSHEHVVSTEELARAIGAALDEHPELKGIADALDINTDDPSKNKHAALDQGRAVRGSLAEARALSEAGLMPGGHVEQATAEAVGELDDPTIDFRLAIGEMIHDVGRASSERDYDEPHSAYYLNPARMGLEARLYAPSIVPKGVAPNILVLLDTSGSVNRTMRRSFLSQIRPLLFTEDSGVKTNAWLFSGDTIVRDEPTVLNQDTFDHLQEAVIKGNGGTDLAAVINSAMAWAEDQDLEFDGVLYFTDLMDFPPTSSKLSHSMPPTVFICPRGYGRKGFADKVGDYAIVADIQEGTSIDLEMVAAAVEQSQPALPAP